MAFLAQFLEGLQLHLSMVFHRFIQGQVSGRRKVKIHVGEVLLEPWDPFCLTERHTESLKPQKYKIETDSGNGTVAVAPFILPKESKFSSPEANKRAKGPRGWNYQQGFYFYRNGRLLQSGGWSYLRTPDEHTKLLRIAVEFSPTLDKAFNINVTKMRAAIPDEIREELKAAVSGWAQKARKVYDAKDRTTSTKSAGPATTPKARMEHSEYSLPKTEMKFGSVSMSVSNANTKGVAASASGAGLKLLVPFKHVSATVFQRKSGRPAEHRDALLTLLALLEAVHDGSINPKKIPIENLKKQIQKLL
jgi:hypothetical protein